MLDRNVHRFPRMRKKQWSILGKNPQDSVLPFQVHCPRRKRGCCTQIAEIGFHKSLVKWRFSLIAIFYSQTVTGNLFSCSLIDRRFLLQVEKI